MARETTRCVGFPRVGVPRTLQVKEHLRIAQHICLQRPVFSEIGRLTRESLPIYFEEMVPDSVPETISCIEFRDFNLGFCQCTFLCTILKCIKNVHKIWDSIHKI